ncbi:hypothetical protein CCO02nite_12100 [Cellulomonas composti]|uniref:Uncharacterized protein n=1 Tax=Cellulomonas composti TaxID=266130 RepID=A0A511J992_9CELL|nr:hypothetical protein CCO02nite_12100 [Cellulomonas composti]
MAAAAAGALGRITPTAPAATTAVAVRTAEKRRTRASATGIGDSFVTPATPVSRADAADRIGLQQVAAIVDAES